MSKQRDQIIVICTGNICRSPMAKCLLEQAIEAEGAPLNSLKVISAGTSAWSGDPASTNSVTALSKVGIELTQHKSQPITKDMLESAFLVLGMTHSHLYGIEKYKKSLPPRVHLFRDFMNPPSDAETEIMDPYGQNLATYRACLDSMAEAIPSLIEFLKKEYLPKLQSEE